MGVLGFGVWGVEFRVWGCVGLGGWGSRGVGFLVSGFGHGVWGFGFLVWGFGFRVAVCCSTKLAAMFRRRRSSQSNNNYFTEMCSGFEEGTYH